jgi:hypothetical protein
MNLPNGAEKVLNARKRGMKPNEMLIVSLIGKTQESNHTIYAAPDGVYDWGWLVGLEVCLFVKPGVFWKPLALSIAKANPRWLGLFDVEQFKGTDIFAIPCIDDIKKPKNQWRYKLDYLPWMPFQNEQFAWGA